MSLQSNFGGLETVVSRLHILRTSRLAISEIGRSVALEHRRPCARHSERGHSLARIRLVTTLRPARGTRRAGEQEHIWAAGGLQRAHHALSRKLRHRWAQNCERELESASATFLFEFLELHVSWCAVRPIASIDLEVGGQCISASPLGSASAHQCISGGRISAAP